MNNVAQTRLRSGQVINYDLTLSGAYLLPGLLAVNTVALLALDRLGGIPRWVKTAAALFLSF